MNGSPVHRGRGIEDLRCESTFFHSTGMSTTRPLLSRDQHFEFGYGEGEHFVPFSKRSKSDENWNVRYGRCRRMPMKFRFECLEAAREISSIARGNVDVLFSGGADSEVALRSFVEAGLNVKAHILRFTSTRGADLNLHDYAWAVVLCDSLNVQYKIHSLDLLEFWKRDAFDYAERTRCVSPQLLSTMWLVDQVDGFAVLGSGENYIVKDRSDFRTRPAGSLPPSMWYLHEKEKIASWYRHFLVRNRAGAPGFFQWNPELMMSWFLDPMIVALWNDLFPGKLDSMSSKSTFYRQHFAIPVRPKFTGFEAVSVEDLRIRTELMKLYGDSDQVVATPISRLLERLSPEPDSFPPQTIFSPHLLGGRATTLRFGSSFLDTRIDTLHDSDLRT